MTAVKTATRTNLSGTKPAAAPMPDVKPEEAVVDEGNTTTVTAEDFKKPIISDQSAAALDTDAEDGHDMTAGNSPSPPHRLSDSTAIAAPSGGALAAAPMQPAERDDHDDLDGEIGFGSFPVLKLQNGTFVIDDVELGNNVDLILISSRKKWIIKEKAQDTTNLVYSYDQRTVAGSTDETIEERIAKWAEEGVDVTNLERKRYQEVVAVVVGSEKNYDKFTKELVLCSVPPASVRRLAGHRAKVKTLYNLKLGDIVTQAFKGRQLKGGNNKVFNPWDFKVVRKAKPADKLAVDLSDSDIELNEDGSGEKE